MLSALVFFPAFNEASGDLGPLLPEGSHPGRSQFTPILSCTSSIREVGPRRSAEVSRGFGPSGKCARTAWASRRRDRGGRGGARGPDRLVLCAPCARSLSAASWSPLRNYRHEPPRLERPLVQFWGGLSSESAPNSSRPCVPAERAARPI